MSVHIGPLRLEAFEQLPKHARRCVFWEVDPPTLGGDILPDPEFEKEAWLSMVMLGGDPAGRWPSVRRLRHHSETRESCLGYALYAPPRAVPRAQRFPTGPVSADAVLLTSMGVRTRQRRGPSGAVAQSCCQRIGASRGAGAGGVRSHDPGHGIARPRAGRPGVAASDRRIGGVLHRVMHDRRRLSHRRRVHRRRTHRYFPRLRLELDKGLGWKAEVEAALERLLESVEVQPVGNWSPNRASDRRAA